MRKLCCSSNANLHFPPIIYYYFYLNLAEYNTQHSLLISRKTMNY